MKNHSVRDLQRMLRIISRRNNNVSPVIPDGIFGEQTERSLKDFQRAYGLEPTGTADRHTWQKLVEVGEGFFEECSPPLPLDAFPPGALPLTPGTKSIYVSILQAVLKCMAEKNTAFLPVTVNGVYDDATESAVKAVQEICRLPRSGRTDKKTWDLMSRVYVNVINN